MEVIPVSLETYSDFIKSKPVVVIHLWAIWNRYDEELKDWLRQIGSSLTDQVEIGSIDTDREEMWELIKELIALNLPALAYYKNGRHIETAVGLHPKEQIEYKLKTLLAMA